MNPCNALIKNAGIRISELYTASLELWLELELQGGGCVIFSVNGVSTEDWGKNQFAYALQRILSVAGTEKFERLVGRPVRAQFKGSGQLGDIIIGIGHFLKEDWFIPREERLWKE
jgi:hypothetical protein